MRIDNNGERVIATMTPDEADTLATIINGALQERVMRFNPDEQELWEWAAEAIYQAAYQAHAINAKNLGG